MQTSFKDVRCVNAGTIPLPKHGRQIEVDPSEIQDEEVLLSSLPETLDLCTCKPGCVWGLQVRQTGSWQDARREGCSCLQEKEAAKVTHAMDGFVHKAFSVAYATSFDEVRLPCHVILNNKTY